MDRSDIADLFRYNEWANARLCDAVEAIAEHDSRRDLGGGFPTLRDTLAHIVGAEWVWLERWLGRSPSAPPPWLDSGVPALREKLRDVEVRRRVFLEALSPEALEQRVAYTLQSGKPRSDVLRHVLVHVVTHSTYHRGQIAAMLRRLGAGVPATDYIEFENA